ncbi:hypothetical protein QQS21_000245 [Conoideocrella luteorostrata]|uniref:Rhodopsin domain-containing protein n=1 Tax=Conoideocrella luteorostrata TaxID=1105319 RepID=A0AAJ0G2Q2_9HYPO|nr:hypothetical protein QQS21_000245 [Conoideocrella luteorostrata]
MALLLLYLQLFGVNNRYRYTLYTVMFYVCGYLFCNLVIEVAQCKPLEKFYRPSTPGHCIDTQIFDILLGVFHMTSDLIIAILPLPVIWRLQLPSKKEKFGLFLVLGGGTIAWVVACVRFVYVSIDLTSKDRTWFAGVTFLMSVLGVNTGLICGCLPTLKPLLWQRKDRSGGALTEQPRRPSNWLALLRVNVLGPPCSCTGVDQEHENGAAQI